MYFFVLIVYVYNWSTLNKLMITVIQSQINVVKIKSDVFDVVERRFNVDMRLF